MNDIANQNAQRLANLSAIFCIVNNIPVTEELGHALSSAVVANVAKWYENNGRPDFNPQTELICDEAIKAAFARMQEIADLATISAQLGINVGGCNA